MSSDTLGLLELLLVFGVVLGLAVRELAVLRRYKARAPEDPPAQSAPDPAHPEGQQSLHPPGTKPLQ